MQKLSDYGQQLSLFGSLTAPDPQIASLSLVVAAVLLVVYVASLWFSLRTHAHLYAGAAHPAPAGHDPPASAGRAGLTLLATAAEQTSSRSSLYFYLMQPFAPDWSGVAFGASLPHRNANRGKMHTLERQAEQLRDAGIWPDAPTTPGSAPPADLSWILNARTGASRPMNPASAGRPYALLVPGASAHRPEKRWPVRQWQTMRA